MSFSAIQQSSLVEQVESQIISSIHSGQYPPGVSLPSEQELSENMQVSRSVVREGISRLKGLGLVESRKKKGTLVTAPKDFNKLGCVLHPSIMADGSAKAIRELRVVIELGLAEILFSRKSDEDIKDLEAIVLKEERAVNMSRDERIELDVMFHKRLYEATHNDMLLQFQSLLLPFFIEIKCNDERYINRVLPFEATHAGLLEILKHGTAEQFRGAMKKHLNKFLEIDQNDE